MKGTDQEVGDVTLKYQEQTLRKKADMLGSIQAKLELSGPRITRLKASLLSSGLKMELADEFQDLAEMDIMQGRSLKDTFAAYRSIAKAK